MKGLTLNWNCDQIVGIFMENLFNKIFVGDYPLSKKL